ncbi:hypothetical protein GW17_00056963 [Ensete ventricosum]|nr:hypothetical protein GW17_00056963 [Ensete ventricosum]
MSSTQVIPPEHISYVHCNFCNTILAVSITLYFAPEKRQRVPSAYNRFINMSFSICREEIQRIKANNPHISHKQAFSTAGKNVSFFSSFSMEGCKECK